MAIHAPQGLDICERTTGKKDNLFLQLLGGFGLYGPNGRVIKLAGRRERSLIAYLALQDEGRKKRQALAEILWDDEAGYGSRDNLRTCLWNLRKALGPDAEAVVVSDRESIGIDFDNLTVDARAFRELAGQSEPLLLADAASLYVGELLEGEEAPGSDFSDWLRDARNQYRQMAVDALCRLVAWHEKRNALDDAIRAAERILQIEPFHEEMFRHLLSLYVTAGRRYLLTSAYDEFAAKLKRDLGVEPEIETRRRFEEALETQPGSEPARDDAIPAQRVAQRELRDGPARSGDRRIAALGHRPLVRVSVVALLVLTVAAVGVIEWSRLGTNRGGENPVASGTEVPGSADEKRYLSTGEIRRRFSDAFVSFRSVRGYDVTTHFKANGGVTGYAQGMTDDGRWWVEADGFTCLQYDRWLKQRKFCFYARLENGVLKRFHADGSPREPDYVFVSGPPDNASVMVEAVQHANCPPGQVTFALGDLDDAPASVLRADVCQAIEKIENWWGTRFDGKLDVAVARNGWPASALELAWRGDAGRVEFPRDQAMARRCPIVLNLMFALAPNQNRLLAEGLGSYAQELFAAAPSYPTYGEGLHLAARKQLRAAIPTGLAQLDKKLPYEPLELVGDTMHISSGVYAGSFVQYLIEEKGWDEFRKLYALTPLRPSRRDGAGSPERWTQVYGVSLERLEVEWKDWLLNVSAS